MSKDLVMTTRKRKTDTNTHSHTLTHIYQSWLKKEIKF